MGMTATLKANIESKKIYESDFLINTAATDTMAPGNKLLEIDIRPAGKMVYEMTDGSIKEYAFGLAVIEFMGEITAGRVIFGPDDSEPILGVTALESVGILIEPVHKTLNKLPAIPLK